jgi:hypothetical protein
MIITSKEKYRSDFVSFGLHGPFQIMKRGAGPSFSRSNPSRSKVCSPSILGGGVRFCWSSVAPLRLGFPGGAGDAEATALQLRWRSSPTPTEAG